MILTPVELELVLLLQKNFLYPKTKEELFKSIDVLDQTPVNIERVMSKSHKVCYNIKNYFEDYTDEQIDNLIKNII